MRVLHVIAPVSFGGGESLLVNLLRERRPDLDETVVSLYHAPEFEQRLQAIGIPTWLLRNTSIGAGVSRRRVLFETPMNLCLAPKLWRVIKDAEADIVHIHGYPGSLLFYLLRSVTNVRGIYTHHFVRQRPSAVERVILGRCYRAFDACTGVSNLVRDSMNRAFFRGGAGFETIYNCVGDSFFARARAGRFRDIAPAGRCIFVHVARFVSHKNQMLVVRALRDLPIHVRGQLHVVFAGDGPELARVRRFGADAGLMDHVTFLGAVRYDDLPGLLSVARFGLFPAENEGFGIAAMECLAAGLPVLSLDVELMEEIVGPAGLRVARDRLAEGLVRMLSEGDRLVADARARGAMFRASVIKDEYMRLYRRVSRLRGVGVGQSAASAA